MDAVEPTGVESEKTPELMADDVSDVSEDDAAVEQMSERERRLYLLKQKMKLSSKANQEAIVEESRRKKTAEDHSHGGDKKRWFEERKKKQEARLKELGLDSEAVHRIESVEVAAAKHKKKDKKEAAFGWDVFNQKTLYRAYKKRAGKVRNRATCTKRLCLKH